MTKHAQIRAAARIQKKTRQVSRAEGASRYRGVWGHAHPGNFEIKRLRNALLIIFHGIFPIFFSGDYFSQLNVSDKRGQNQDEASASFCLMLSMVLQVTVTTNKHTAQQRNSRKVTNSSQDKLMSTRGQTK